MKKSQIQELIRQIVRQALDEYTVPVSNSQPQTQDGLDPNVPPTDAMTSAEKSRIERQQELDRQKDLKQKRVELDAEKKQQDFYKKKVDQSRRFDIPTLNKDIQKLSGANI
jgi:hypothetical protein